MAIALDCAGCGKVTNVADALAGKKVKCPGCGAVLDVPVPPSAGLEARLAQPAPPAASPYDDAPLHPPAAAPPKPKPSPRALWFVALFLLLFGGIFFGVGYWMVSKAADARTWPTVQGTVERSAVVSKEKREDGKTTTMYSADIAYRYEVNGTPYKSTSITAGGMGSSSNIRSWAESDVEKYPVGSRPAVHYNPKDPSDACLETRAGFGPWLFLIIGGVIDLIGLALLVSKIRSSLR